MNAQFNTIFLREKIIHLIRKFFQQKKFHEVETPLLVPAVIPESYLDYFETFLITNQGKKKRLFLTTSPEASIKKLLSIGIGNCFEITKSFRNCESGSFLHSAEFTILEWYRINADYFNIMQDCQDLFQYLLFQLTNRKNYLLEYQNKQINLASPWKKISVISALKKYADISFDDITCKKEKNLDKMFPVAKIVKTAKQKGYQAVATNTWEQLFHQIFLNEIEPQLVKENKPVFIYDYPRPLAALAKLKKNDQRLSQRFELYIAGVELADCYSELTDWKEQQQRFLREEKILKQKGYTHLKVDYDLTKALNKGIPSCSGIACGVDRMVMLFANLKDIADVQPFSFSF